MSQCLDTSHADACTTFSSILESNCPGGLCTGAVVPHNDDVFNTIHGAMDLAKTALKDPTDGTYDKAQHENTNQFPWDVGDDLQHPNNKFRKKQRSLGAYCNSKSYEKGTPRGETRRCFLTPGRCLDSSNLEKMGRSKWKVKDPEWLRAYGITPNASGIETVVTRKTLKKYCGDEDGNPTGQSKSDCTATWGKHHTLER